MTLAADSPPARRRLDFGRVVREAARVLRSDWLVLAALGLVLVGLPELAKDHLRPLWQHRLPEQPEFWAVSAGMDLIDSVLGSLIGAVVTRIALDRLEDKRRPLPEVFRATLAVFPVILLINLATNWNWIVALANYFPESPVASVLQTILLLAWLAAFPASWALLGVSTPVVIAETSSLALAVARTLKLMTAGRWSFLVILAVVTTLQFIAEVRLLPNQFWATLTAETSIRIALLMFTAAYYRELCRVRDGGSPHEFADAFD
jgi:hypothetical protein